MRKIQEMIVITEGYPNPDNPYRYTFVEQLVQEFSRQGIHVTVINPVFHNYRQYQYRDEWSHEVEGGQPVKVYQPRIINFSMKSIGGFKMMHLTYRSFYAAVRRITARRHLSPDAVYAHFTFPSGCAAAELGRKLGVPAYFATGESNIAEITENLGKDFLQKKLSGIRGIVSVSSENKRVLTESGIADPKRVRVFPNGVDQELFYPRDRKEMRTKYGFPDKAVIGAFVGAFSDRKGVMRVNQASDITHIPMIYIGEGEQKPAGEYAVFSGGVRHDRIPEYLSAADFFVLPTRHEGCCNAIVEAICCGLPVISSDGEFNDDILDEKYSIRVDPDSVRQIARAMEQLAGDETLRRKMAENALRQRERFNLQERAARIIRFMNETEDA